MADSLSRERHCQLTYTREMSDTLAIPTVFSLAYASRAGR